MVQRAAVQKLFTHNLTHRADRLASCSFDIGKILPLAVATEVTAFSDVQEIAGHGFDVAGLFIPLTREVGCRSSRSPRRFAATCGFRSHPAISAIPLAPIV